MKLEEILKEHGIWERLNQKPLLLAIKQWAKGKVPDEDINEYQVLFYKGKKDGRNDCRNEMLRNIEEQ